MPYQAFKIFRNPLIYLNREMQRNVVLMGESAAIRQQHASAADAPRDVYSLDLNRNVPCDANMRQYHNAISLYELSLLKKHGILRKGMYLTLQMRLYEDVGEGFGVLREPLGDEISHGTHHVVEEPAPPLQHLIPETLRLSMHTREKLSFFHRTSVHPRALLLCEDIWMGSAPRSSSSSAPAPNPSYHDEYREIIEMCLSVFGTSLQYLPENMKDDRHLAMNAVLADSFALKYASSRLKSDKTFIIECMRRMNSVSHEGGGNTNAFLNSFYAPTFTLALTHLEQEWYDPESDALSNRRLNGRRSISALLQHMNTSLLQDRDVALIALELDASVFKQLPLNVQQEQAFLKKAIRANWRVYTYLPFALQQRPELREIYMEMVEDEGEESAAGEETGTSPSEAMQMLEQLMLGSMSTSGRVNGYNL